MKLLLLHGWGFDGGVWDELAALLGPKNCLVEDRGYFGSPHDIVPAAPFVAITHSFGTMRFLAGGNPYCRGFVALNGFDRLTVKGSFPGVPRRVVDRMARRFEGQPQEVLAEFRLACGDAWAGETFDEALLLGDLVTLREGDCRDSPLLGAVPVLSIQGANDAIVPAAMREAVFARARNCVRLTHPAAGHLLPQEDAAYCAEAVAAFMGRLT